MITRSGGWSEAVVSGVRRAVRALLGQRAATASAS
jgi:hypothetical protein